MTCAWIRNGLPSCSMQPTRIGRLDRKSTRLNSSHSQISYAVFCLKKKKKNDDESHRIAETNQPHIQTHTAKSMPQTLFSIRHHTTHSRSIAFVAHLDIMISRRRCF